MYPVVQIAPIASGLKNIVRNRLCLCCVSVDIYGCTVLPVGSSVSLLVQEVGVRLPCRSNGTQCGQRFATAALLLRRCVAQTLSRGDGPAGRYALRRNSGSIMKI